VPVEAAFEASMNSGSIAWALLAAGDLVVGADFNVGTMAWLLIRVIRNTFHVVREIVGHDTDTWKQSEALAEGVRKLCAESGRYFVDDVKRRASVTVYADASGGARRTSAARSDIDIIRGEGFQVRRFASNPAVRDRSAAVQLALAEGRLPIDPSCVKTIAALEEQGYDAGGREPDKSTGHDHYADALGYPVYWIDPVRAVAPARSRGYDEDGRSLPPR
jgi:hypothetical protein